MTKDSIKWAVDIALDAVEDKPDMDVTVSVYEHSVTISFYHTKGDN